MSEFRLAGVMGWPIGHSRSPTLHGHWLARYGIRGAYVPMAIPPERLEAALRALPVLGFRGCNLTVPLKEAAVRIVDHLHPSAARTGSVNTVIARPDGTLEGRSTDGEGFMANLVEGAPDWRPGDRPVLLVGAGGAARSVAAALLDAGVGTLRLVNRTEERAGALAGDIVQALDIDPRRIDVLSWAQRHEAVADCSLVVNSTVQGMRGEAPLDLSLDRLAADAVVTDLVYVPLETPLLAAARARGARVVDGLGMLLHQARPGFSAWFGVEPVVDEALRAAVLGAGIP